MRFTLAAVLVLGHAMASGGFDIYSLAEERRIGQTTSETLQSHLKLVRDSKLDAYLGELVTKLTGHVDSPFQYSVFTFTGAVPVRAQDAALVMPVGGLQTKLQEPISVAGGAIFVPLTLLANAPREEWFAFQIAHSIAHAALRHASRLESRTSLVELGMTQLMALRLFSRNFELDADRFALSALAQAGYDPSRLFPLPTDAEANPLRPSSGRREEHLRKAAIQLSERQYIPISSAFEQMKAIAASRIQDAR